MRQVVGRRAFNAQLGQPHPWRSGRPAWNWLFDCACYHPNFLFNQFGMLERCALRPGHVHSADGWEDVLDPVIARYAKLDIMRFFRADLKYQTAEEFAVARLFDKTQWAQTFELPDGSAPAAIAHAAE